MKMLLTRVKRKISRELKKRKRKLFINKEDRHLLSEKVIAGLNVKKKAVALFVSGEMYTPVKVIAKAAVISVRFFDQEGIDVSEKSPLYGMKFSAKHGSYKYLRASPQVESFHLLASIPKSAVRVHVSIMQFKGSNVYLKSGATIEFENFNCEEKLSDVVVATEEHIKLCGNIDVNTADNIIGKKISDKDKTLVLKKTLEFFSGTNEKVEIAFGKVLFRHQPSLDTAMSVKHALTKAGRMYDTVDFIEEVESKSIQGWSLSSRRIRDELDKLENGFPFSKVNETVSYEKKHEVLYLLHNSLPYNSGGYGTRTHGLLKGIKKETEYNVSGVSRPGYPTDHKKHISYTLPEVIPEVDVIDGVQYLRCDQKTKKSSLTLTEYIDAYAGQLVEHAKKHHVKIIHAASNYPNGLAAIESARRLGIKSVYEVRGLWEITRMSRQINWDKTDQFKFMAKMEAEVCKNADAVITITHALKDLMVSRGVDESKITVVPNCVHINQFIPFEQRDQALAEKLGIKNDDVVIGYIGSIVNYEGLDDLMHALKLMRDAGVNGFKMLLVGDGAFLQVIKGLIKEFKLQDTVICTGRVPHAEVRRYYSLVDITPFPRKPFLVCEAVSPLKPFESMASGKAVVVSSCAALTEIVTDGENGLVFEKGNVESLASVLKELIVDKGLRMQLGQTGYEWVCRERDWEVSARTVGAVYRCLDT